MFCSLSAPPAVADAHHASVSSTLDKSVSKKHLFDSSPETCWTSAQGLPQFIHLIFDDPVAPSSLSLTFQGGFVGIRCAIYTLSTHASQLQLLTHVFPEDVNRRQSFPLDVPSSGITQFKVVFEESSDFFGRITVYDMRLDTSLPEPVL